MWGQLWLLSKVSRAYDKQLDKWCICSFSLSLSLFCCSSIIIIVIRVLGLFGNFVAALIVEVNCMMEEFRSDVTTVACWPPLRKRFPFHSGRRQSLSQARTSDRSILHHQCDLQRTSVGRRVKRITINEMKWEVVHLLVAKTHLFPTSLILKKAMPVSKESEPAWCCGPILSSSSCSATSCSPPWKQNKKKEIRTEIKAWLFKWAKQETLCALCCNTY